jgi:hypothetical protein
MGRVFVGSLAGSVLGLILGITFGAVGREAVGGPHANREFFAALVGWAAGGVIGAVGAATVIIERALMITEAGRHQLARPMLPGREVPPENRPG